MSEADRQTVRRIIERAWNHQDFTGLEDAIAPGATFHFRGSSRPTDLDDLERLVAMWREAFPDLHMEIHDMIAEGDRVAVRLTHSGTHRGSWKGREPTGAYTEVDEMLFFRFEAGRVVEIWEVTDEHMLWQQIEAAEG